MKIQGKSFEVNKEDKLLFPNYTKKQVMEYYEKIASDMLPHIENRPLTMIRYPDGIEGKRFFQKNTPDYFPDWIKTKKLSKKDGGEVDYALANDQASLVYLASQACLTLHTWQSNADHPNKPNRLIFDLDPSDEDFEKVKNAAKLIRNFFNKKFKTDLFLMTTGSSGLHLLLPIKPELEFEEVLKFCQELSKHLAELHPDELTAEVRKDKRGKKNYVDVMRNAYGQTAVAAYSLRARPGAPVATPIEWEELNGLKSAQQYKISNIYKRLAQKQDPWKKLSENPVDLKKMVLLLF